jgi:hypothetical protein
LRIVLASAPACAEEVPADVDDDGGGVVAV